MVQMILEFFLSKLQLGVSPSKEFPPNKIIK
jgi:hypothetical protein